MLVGKVVDHRVDTVCPSESFPSWDKTGDGWFRTMLHEIVFYSSAPPGDSILIACQKHTVYGKVSVDDGVCLGGWSALGMFLMIRQRMTAVISRTVHREEGNAVLPHLQGESGLCQRLVSHLHRLLYRR